jgi:hypothetical protein
MRVGVCVLDYAASSIPRLTESNLFRWFSKNLRTCPTSNSPGTHMRAFALFIGLLLAVSVSLCGQTRVSIAQLEQFLQDNQKAHISDAVIASKLSSAELAEQLTEPAIARLSAKLRLGPRTLERLNLLSAASLFAAPPSAEQPSLSVPDQAGQQSIRSAAQTYVASTLHRLPDFLAIRQTNHYDNTPQSSGKRHAPPVIEMHFTSQHRREVAYRQGRELPASGSNDATTSTNQGLTTFGEFGPILDTVFADSASGSFAWNRWQTGPTGPLAVFRYSVPESASHYQLDFCCWSTETDPTPHKYRGKPAYHGEVSIDPATSAIARITIKADLDPDGMLTASAIAVDFAPVSIAGRSYICPVRGVALSTFHNQQMKRLDGVGLERHINLVRFLDYHKFVANARILLTP